MLQTYINTKPGEFLCRQNPRFYYTLCRKDSEIECKVYRDGKEFVSFTKDHTEGYLLLFLFGGIEANMELIYKKCHKECKRIIHLEIKNGC